MPELLAKPLQASTLSRANPFPGLRPYGEEDAMWLFGRSREINDLLKRLRRLHFVAIVGASGSGKSSLVRAGVLPQVRDGYLDAEWRIAQFRPGERPLANLAEALGPELAIDPAELAHRLHRGPSGIVRSVEAAELPRGSKVLILVDQFEELFQFAQRTGDSAQEEIKEFLKLLLTAAGSDDVAVYVVVTMRLEWLSECSSYAGLAEAINEGLYLVPQMRRQQFQQAILGPLESADGSVTSALLDRMLNDLDNKSDQLPVLQHALLRLWDRNGAREPFEMAGYEAVGTFSNCLSAHAEEVYAELTDRQKHVAELLFRTITQVNKGRKMRRPRPVGDILEATKSTFAELEAVILAFSRPGRSFLVMTQGALTSASIVDLSHEALIRQWTRLAGWVEHEAEIEARLHRLREDAADWDRDRKASKDCLYTGSRLVRAAELQPMLTPRSPEAAFLKESIRARAAVQARKYSAIVIFALALLSLSVLYLSNRAKTTRAAEALMLKQAQLETALATEQAKKAQDFQQNLVQRIDAAKGDKTALAAIAQSIQAQRVYVQYAPGGAQLAKALQTQLRKRSYSVPSIEQVSSDKGPAQSQVRYFYGQDHGEAQKIFRLVNPLLAGNVELQAFDNPKGVIPPGQFEVWIASAAQVSPSAPPPAQTAAATPAETKPVAPSVEGPAPIITADVSPEHIQQGGSVLLSWSTLFAEEVTISTVGPNQSKTTLVTVDRNRSELITRRSVTPAKTTTYSFTASGPGGSTEKSVTVEVYPVPPATPLPTSDAAASPEPAAIKAAIVRYREAYEGESLDDMKKAWPTIPKAQQKNLKTAFEMFNAIRLTVNCKDDDLHVQGDTASAKCTQSAVYTIKGTRQPEQTTAMVFHLRRSPSGWVVDTVQ